MDIGEKKRSYFELAGGGCCAMFPVLSVQNFTHKLQYYMLESGQPFRVVIFPIVWLAATRRSDFVLPHSIKMIYSRCLRPTEWCVRYLRWFFRRKLCRSTWICGDYAFVVHVARNKFNSIHKMIKIKDDHYGLAEKLELVKKC